MLDKGVIESPCMGPGCCDHYCCIFALLQGTVGLLGYAANSYIPGAEFLINLMFPCTALYACGFRARLRERYALPIMCSNDCCFWYCCAPCALRTTSLLM